MSLITNTIVFENDYARIIVLKNGAFVDIVRADINKANGLYILMNLLGAKYEDVTVVGDNVNDKDMIEEFNSYAMENGVDTIKKLAEESAAAAGQTTQLIETTIAAVEKGIVIAEETATDMEEVMVGAKEATVKMSAIAEILVKEAEEIQEVNERVATISEVVSNNSASSEETAAVSEEQTAQVQTMVELMGQFRI